MPCKKSLKKNNRRGRKRTLKRKQKGGGLVLPSEYFGGNSGRYSAGNADLSYINTVTGNMEPISQGMENSDGTIGPKLDYYPSLMDQTGGGGIGDILNFFKNKTSAEKQIEDLAVDNSQLKQNNDLLEQEIQEALGALGAQDAAAEAEEPEAEAEEPEADPEAEPEAEAPEAPEAPEALEPVAEPVAEAPEAPEAEALEPEAPEAPEAEALEPEAPEEQIGGIKRNRRKYKSRRQIRKGKNMSGGKRRKNIKKKNKTKRKQKSKRSLRKRK